MIWAEVWNLLFVRKLLKNKFLFVCVKGKFGSRNPDRHGWFSTSAAPLISASSRELARKNSVLRHTHGGGLCALRWRKSTYRLVSDFCFRFAPFTWRHRMQRMPQADDIIFVMSHAQIYIEWRITYLIVNLRMQHNRDYALSLYACVARSASCEWLIISLCKYRKRSILSGKAIKQTTEFHEFLREWERPLFQAWERARWKRRETRVVSV